VSRYACPADEDIFWTEDGASIEEALMKLRKTSMTPDLWRQIATASADLKCMTKQSAREAVDEVTGDAREYEAGRTERSI
jgi:hypothetical protein